MQTHTTKGQFKAELGILLDDPNKVRWTDKELNIRISEALYNWGAFGYFRDSGQLTVGSANRFYDLTTSLVGTGGDFILKKNLTFGHIVDSICFDLLEVRDEANLFDVFSENDILVAIDRKLDEFKLQTGFILSVDEFLVDAGTVDLGNEKLDFVRLAFKDVADDDASKHKYYKLHKADENNLRSFSGGFNVNVARRPKYFSRVLGSTNLVRLYPPFTNTGFLHVISINGRDKDEDLDRDLNLGIPDNFSIYLKMGVLADLFQSETPMKDVQRAKYCEQRWKEGISIGKFYLSVLNADINGKSSGIGTINDLDNFEVNWQNITGNPNKIALAGYNILVLNKGVSEDTSLLVDVVKNAIIPITDEAFIPVKPEYLGAILNYCYHLCMLKEGFSDLMSSQQFLNQFGNMAMVYNAKMMKEVVSFEALTNSRKQDTQKPRFDKELRNATATSA